MISTFIKQGIPANSIQAAIIGGASVIENLTTGFSIGIKNIDTARKVLKQHNIPVIKEFVGGNKGIRISIDNKLRKIMVDELEIFSF